MKKLTKYLLVPVMATAVTLCSYLVHDTYDRGKRLDSLKNKISDVDIGITQLNNETNELNFQINKLKSELDVERDRIRKTVDIFIEMYKLDKSQDFPGVMQRDGIMRFDYEGGCNFWFF